MLALWEDGPDGRSPQGRELAQQLARELGTGVPVLPPSGAQNKGVRRLTPREAERLQGFPDDYTLIPYRTKPAADAPRYMAVNVRSWLGQRIALADGLAVQEPATMAA
jgi:site-specific DNA-cytosine methylase